MLTGGGDDEVFISAQFGVSTKAIAFEAEAASDVRVYLHGGAGRNDCLQLFSFVPDVIIRAFEECNDDRAE